MYIAQYFSTNMCDLFVTGKVWRANSQRKAMAGCRENVAGSPRRFRRRQTPKRHGKWMCRTWENTNSSGRHRGCAKRRRRRHRKGKNCCKSSCYAILLYNCVWYTAHYFTPTNRLKSQKPTSYTYKTRSPGKSTTIRPLWRHRLFEAPKWVFNFTHGSPTVRHEPHTHLRGQFHPPRGQPHGPTGYLLRESGRPLQGVQVRRHAPAYLFHGAERLPQHAGVPQGPVPGVLGQKRGRENIKLPALLAVPGDGGGGGQQSAHGGEAECHLERLGELWELQDQHELKCYKVSWNLVHFSLIFCSFSCSILAIFGWSFYVICRSVPHFYLRPLFDLCWSGFHLETFGFTAIQIFFFPALLFPCT